MSREPEFDRLASRLSAELREIFGPPCESRALPEPPAVAGLPEFVLESEAGLLLGEPPARSVSLALPVFGPDDLEGGVWAFGEDFARASPDAPRDFLQLLIVPAPAPASRALLSRLAALRSLPGRLPGWLAHSVEAETTARVHRDLLAAGFSQRHLARAHLDQLRARGFEGRALVAVGLVERPVLERMAPYWGELRRLRTQLSAQAAGPAAGPASGDGCEGRSCVSCDERVVCDKVRAVLAASARERRER